MPTAYAYMTDDELVQELADYRKALKSVSIGGGLKVIAGEGRRKEFNPGDSGAIQAALRELTTEFNLRPNLSGTAGLSGGSLPIEFGHGGFVDDGGAPYNGNYFYGE